MSSPIKELLEKNLSKGESYALNSLLATEISEVEIYNRAIQKIQDINLIPTLEQCRNSHAQRVSQLKNRIEELGSTPVSNPDFVGNLMKFAEDGASVLNDQATIGVLAGSESFHLQQYECLLNSLDAKSYDLIQSTIIPAHKQTYETISTLHAAMLHGN